jgi:SAM-dependent methyltransferase
LKHVFLDLGFAPPSNAYIDRNGLQAQETWFPLKTYVCSNCWLVQTEDYSKAHELFGNDYAYFSSTSSTWLDHAQLYVKTITERLTLDEKSFVIEIASNDGYLLKNFVANGIPCLGIEPTASTAAIAESLSIPVIKEFFGKSMASSLVIEGKQADLILGNNVYAHVPDINDFTAGMKTLLKPGGTITLEFPHFLEMIRHSQFDTVYHEHYSYLSLFTVQQIFQKFGLRIFDVEQLSTHGGSLRIFGCHDDDMRTETRSVSKILALEENEGLRSLGVYSGFQSRAEHVKNELLSFLVEKKLAGKIVAGYGAAAKGNTLLNFAGIKPDLLTFICDAAPSKQGKFMPGSHIPILTPTYLEKSKPDFVLILPWNIADEVLDRFSHLSEHGVRFLTAVPNLRYL